MTFVPLVISICRIPAIDAQRLILHEFKLKLLRDFKLKLLSQSFMDSNQISTIDAQQLILTDPRRISWNGEVKLTNRKSHEKYPENAQKKRTGITDQALKSKSRRALGGMGLLSPRIHSSKSQVFTSNP